MTSARAKGRTKELKAAEVLEARGWTVELAHPQLQFIGPGKVISRKHDLFGVFDLVAVRRYDPTLWVQSTDLEHVAARRDKVEEFARHHIDLGRLGHHRVQVWAWGRTQENGWHWDLYELMVVKDRFLVGEREPGKWCRWERIGLVKRGNFIPNPKWEFYGARIFEVAHVEKPAPGPSPPTPQTNGQVTLDSFIEKKARKGLAGGLSLPSTGATGTEL